MVDLMANMKNTLNEKCDVNVKIKNIRASLFRVSVFDVKLINFLNRLACKLTNSQPNLASKSIEQQKHHTFKKALNVMLGNEFLVIDTLKSTLV